MGSRQHSTAPTQPCGGQRKRRDAGTDGDRLVVAGDSAGGNLAAAVGLLPRDRHGPPIELHYRSESRYCNPYSGHEKGNVENAVGFLRRNLMVPEPEAATLVGLNEVLLACCDALATTTHYRKGLALGELFTQDVAASWELPGVGFDPVRYESRRAEKVGNLLIDANTYAAGARLPRGEPHRGACATTSSRSWTSILSPYGPSRGPSASRP
ncbi:alpha/beta hydrolase fold domain-containing protein [Pseudarthrobacter sp. H3Y2-7]|uniref:alpha/beta hydrolase fold domain-containing protein n=1 Tax=Pseudarthrobacter naphthalenicus TaxID=3031328 RepID=UPI0023B19ABD|nr:alpha/beta hydrolase fold domain-containing protein [Pseudarthrobacter sp. H3Y2-7]MDE8671090.1 alpha/beta hydrolase fold domain-containing protein [Pseudarthrobacter sp. H3Y2-7]